MVRVTVCLLAGLLAVGIGGCQSSDDTGTAEKKTTKTLLCAKCGQVKGSDLCCKPEQEICAKCELVKGSPGCCVLPKGTTEDVELCTKCGLIKGSDQCCKIEGKTMCSKCGLVKGSPGCCLIK